MSCAQPRAKAATSTPRRSQSRSAWSTENQKVPVSICSVVAQEQPQEYNSSVVFANSADVTTAISGVERHEFVVGLGQLEGTTVPSVAPKSSSAVDCNGAALDCCNSEQQQYSWLTKLRVMNIQEAKELFFASGFQNSPQFNYRASIAKQSQSVRGNKNVSFHLLPHASRILSRAAEIYGGPENLTQSLYGDDSCSAEAVRAAAVDYLKRQSLHAVVDVRVVDSMLSAAQVQKSSCVGKYILNVCPRLLTPSMLIGLLDHEIGTHLLRTMNDLRQPWHENKSRYNLASFYQVETTEEGLATLNTYQSLPSKLMHEHALRYYAVCYGAHHGFVELFNELRRFIVDVELCWLLCCRVKRGLVDTSLHGSLWRDQSYFQGAVEILEHVHAVAAPMQLVQFGSVMKLLYSGRISVKDLNKAALFADLTEVRMPHFLCDARRLNAYKIYLQKIAKENLLDEAVFHFDRPINVLDANARAVSGSPSSHVKRLSPVKQRRQARTQSPPRKTSCKDEDLLNQLAHQGGKLVAPLDENAALSGSPSTHVRHASPVKHRCFVRTQSPRRRGLRKEDSQRNVVVSTSCAASEPSDMPLQSKSDTRQPSGYAKKTIHAVDSGDCGRRSTDPKVTKGLGLYVIHAQGWQGWAKRQAEQTKHISEESHCLSDHRWSFASDGSRGLGSTLSRFKRVELVSARRSCTRSAEIVEDMWKTWCSRANFTTTGNNCLTVD